MRNVTLTSSLILMLLVLPFAGKATTEKYRLSYRDDPSTTIVIGWNQVSGSNPVVYYDTVDHGTNHLLYAWTHGVDRSVAHKGMSNQFARLTGLDPNQEYYFLIRDTDGNSARYWFRTIPDDPSERLSFIAGGDSRSDWTARQNANMMVAKLRPHAVLFGGDYTNGNTNAEWTQWFTDWQLTVSSDGRMYPIVATRGNHEGSNNDVYNLFDVPSTEVYYALNFGGTLYRAYTLNSEISQTGAQATWLANDLAAWENGVTWKSAQYHRPCRPHESGKSDQSGIYDFWVPEFEDHGVRLVVECDAHVVKRTWPILRGTGAGTDNGFYRDDSLGIVYVGEGTWAPLRTNDDDKAWTRNSGSFNSFKWIWMDQCEIELRTVQTSNVGSVGTLTDANIFTLPANINIWNPSNGDILRITNYACDLPSVSVTNPTDGQYFPSPTGITITATASDNAPGFVTGVEFFVDGLSIGTDNTAPYSIPWTIPANGNYVITAVATDNDGYTATSSDVNIAVGIVTTTSQVNSSSDDAEESSAGVMYLNSSDLEIVWDGNDQWVGMRFNNVNVPQGATIQNAYIQFTVDETPNTATNVTFWGEDTDNATTFTSANFNISGRTRTTANVAWNPVTWSAVGAAGVDQRSSDIASIVQEIVDRAGWSSGNSLAIVTTGTGERVAESYDGVPGAAPILVITYTLPGGPLPLPQVNPFQGSRGQGGVDLSWRVEPVFSPLQFQIQRSFDGLNFSTIRVVDAGLSASALWYTHRDSDAPAGQLFYRLRMVDRNGEENFTHVVEILSGDGPVKFYPQPAQDRITVEFGSNINLSSVRIFDASGRTLPMPRMISSTQRTFTFDLSRYAAGVYFIELRKDDHSLIRKRIIVE